MTPWERTENGTLRSMWVAFLLLLAVGPLAAMTAVSSRTVTELAYRGLTLLVLLPLFAGGLWGLVRTPLGSDSPVVHSVQIGLVGLTVVVAIAAWVSGCTRRLALARGLSATAAVLAVLAASHVLHDEMVARGTGLTPGPKLLAMSLQTAACLLTLGNLGLPPVVLISLGQGWTRALRRLRPLWAGLSLTTALTAMASAIFTEPQDVAITLTSLRWLGLAVLLFVAFGCWRTGGAGLRLPGRRRPLRDGLLVLTAWLVSIPSSLLGLVLLRASGWPL